MRRIQSTFVGRRASRVPLRLPAAQRRLSAGLRVGRRVRRPARTGARVAALALGLQRLRRAVARVNLRGEARRQRRRGRSARAGQRFRVRAGAPSPACGSRSRPSRACECFALRARRVRSPQSRLGGWWRRRRELASRENPDSRPRCFARRRAPRQLQRARTAVGHADLVALVRVHPDLANAAVQHRRRQPLLQLQRDAHGCCFWLLAQLLPAEPNAASEGARKRVSGRGARAAPARKLRVCPSRVHVSVGRNDDGRERMRARVAAT